MPSFSIPPITDARISELLKTIRPLVQRKGDLWYIKLCDPRTQSFMWEPKLDGKAASLVFVAEVQTLHTFGYHGFFKPSLAEVLAQIPAELTGRITAFEVIGPEDAEALNRQIEYVDAGYHRALTKLYIAGSAPEPEKKEPVVQTSLDKIAKVLG